MTSRSLFAIAGRDNLDAVDDEMHRHLGPLISEFIQTASLERAGWTMERIARGMAALNWGLDPLTERRCAKALNEIIGARRRNTKDAPLGLEAKAARWLQMGQADSRSDIEAWVAEQAEYLPSAEARPVVATPFSWVDPATLPQREWLYGRHLIRGEVSATLAPGGVGKTSLAIVEALAMVTGFPLLGYEPANQLRVWIWNGEEPIDELRRRLAAAMKHFGIVPDMVADRLFISTGHDLPLVLAEDGRDGTQVHLPIVHELVGELRNQHIDAMLVDPFVSTHNVGENDNNAIQKAATAWKEVAVGANVAIGLAHHTRKLGGKEATTEDARGADALISKVRDGRVLNVMSEADAARLGVLGRDRFGYFSTGPGGKSNMSARTGDKSWFRLVSVDLGNGRHGGAGDAVAVVERWTAPHVGDEIEPERLVKLGTIMGEAEWRAAPQASSAPDWIGAAVADAFDLSRDEGWKPRVKRLVAELERRSVIAPGTVVGANRKRRPVFTYVGGPKCAAALID